MSLTEGGRYAVPTFAVNSSSGTSVDDSAMFKETSLFDKFRNFPRLKKPVAILKEEHLEKHGIHGIRDLN